MSKELLSSVILLSLSCVGMQNAIACDDIDPIWQSMQNTHITLRSKNGESHQLLVKIANSRTQRRAGFQNICAELIQQWGILFVFPKRQRSTFHMRNVKGDLDIGFLDTDGRLVELQRMNHGDSSHQDYIYRAKKPFRYALETGGGTLFSLGMDKGSWWLVIDASWN